MAMLALPVHWFLSVMHAAWLTIGINYGQQQRKSQTLSRINWKLPRKASGTGRRHGSSQVNNNQNHFRPPDDLFIETETPLEEEGEEAEAEAETEAVTDAEGVGSRHQKSQLWGLNRWGQLHRHRHRHRQIVRGFDLLLFYLRISLFALCRLMEQQALPSACARLSAATA